MSESAYTRNFRVTVMFSTIPTSVRGAALSFGNRPFLPLHFLGCPVGRDSQTEPTGSKGSNLTKKPVKNSTLFRFHAVQCLTWRQKLGRFRL